MRCYRFVTWSANGSLFVVAFVATGCLCWTIWLMLLTAAPNDTINWLMDTKSFDGGSFWRFIQPHPSALFFGLGGLGCIALAYLYIIVRTMTSSQTSFKKIPQLNRKTKSTVAAAPANRREKRVLSGDREGWIAITKSSKLNIVLKYIDLGIQIYQLVVTMENGMPVLIVTIFTAIIVLNALTTAVNIAGHTPYTGLPELLLDTVFDFVVAVGLPMFTQLYCLTTFRFDRKLLAINLEIFPPGWFERGASINSDPVEAEIIRSSLNSLRIFSVISVFARVGTNCALCRRFYQLAALIKDPTRRNRRIYPRHKPSANVFVLISMITVIFVEESIRTSAVACSPHPECVQHSHRWVLLHENDLEQCPCLTLIDSHPGVKTFDEWIDPPSVMMKVSQLAISGKLEMVSLVNRRLSALPDELRKCSDLRHLSLVYTNTENLPVWMKELVKLEYLHIEGKIYQDNLVAIPDDMFQDMLSLTFLHLAAISVSRLPPMKTLTNLKYLTLAVLLNLQELPSFEGLQSLETLVLSLNPLVDSIPDTSPLRSLELFATAGRGMFCCNGFVGECDLTIPMCSWHPLWGTSPVVCLASNRSTKLPTAATLETFARFSYAICADRNVEPGQLETGPTKAASAQCGGIQFRQCKLPNGGIGMCYSSRMMGIDCNPNPLPQIMRRRQIAESVGVPCDPEYEAWLGCTS